MNEYICNLPQLWISYDNYSFHLGWCSCYKNLWLTNLVQYLTLKGIWLIFAMQEIELLVFRVKVLSFFLESIRTDYKLLVNNWFRWDVTTQHNGSKYVNLFTYMFNIIPQQWNRMNMNNHNITFIILRLAVPSSLDKRKTFFCLEQWLFSCFYRSSTLLVWTTKNHQINHRHPIVSERTKIAIASNG